MNYSDIENAFFFVSSADPFEHSAVVHRITGETFIASELSGESDYPEDVEESDDYIAIPHKHDLELRIPMKSATYSDGSRPPIPIDLSRAFRSKSATP